jgi:hypothetical protein
MVSRITLADIAAADGSQVAAAGGLEKYRGPAAPCLSNLSLSVLGLDHRELGLMECLRSATFRVMPPA